MDRESLITVAEDIHYLAGWGGDMTDAEIRRGTATLRRLLVEDAYGHAWRAIGQEKQPSLLAVDLDQVIASIESRIHLALAGGANFRGLQYAAIVLHDGLQPLTITPPSSVREGGFPYERSFTLSEYLSSPSGIVEGHKFNRREVIKYIANVKGGVHLSAKQRKEEAKLIARLGKVEKKIMVQMSDGLLVEAVAIGQALGTSSDAQRYLELATKL